MEGDREALSMPSFDGLDDFAPRRAAAPSKASSEPARAGQGGSPAALQARSTPRAADTRRAIDAVSQFPSREAASDGQLNLKGPRDVLDRFRKLCKDDRRAYYDMLTILMDSYEGKTPG